MGESPSAISTISILRKMLVLENVPVNTEFPFLLAMLKYPPSIDDFFAVLIWLNIATIQRGKLIL